jgi:hypothetical protein
VVAYEYKREGGSEGGSEEGNLLQRHSVRDGTLQQGVLPAALITVDNPNHCPSNGGVLCMLTGTCWHDDHGVLAAAADKLVMACVWLHFKLKFELCRPCNLGASSLFLWLQVPLVTLVGASNELPESEELDALYDRFLIRKEVKQVTAAGGGEDTYLCGGMWETGGKGTQHRPATSGWLVVRPGGGGRGHTLCRRQREEAAMVPVAYPGTPGVDLQVLEKLP